MSIYSKYLQKVNTQSVDYLKQRNLKDRLLFDYNREKILYNDKIINVIIQLEKFSNNESYYKISADNDAGLKTGNVFLWQRLNTHFMIFSQRNTEKSYFIGRIYEAKYSISYLDTFNNKVTQFGVVKSINDTIRDEAIGATQTVAELIDGDMVLYLEKTETINSLKKRGKKIKIQNRNWEIKGWDDLTYDNIILFNLAEVLNYNEDSEEIPYPELDYTYATITSNIDNIEEIQNNSSIELKVKTIFKDTEIQEDYNIETINCSYSNGIINFANIGLATITITGNKTKATKQYELDIQETFVENQVLKIIGRGLVKKSVPYSYSVKLLNNGTEISKEELNANYTISFEKDEVVKIKKIDVTEFFLKIEDIGNYKIKIILTNKNTMLPINKEITVESEDILA